MFRAASMKNQIRTAARIAWTLAMASLCTPEAQGADPDYGHLSLREAEAVLAGANREMLAAERAVEAARADMITASARPNPNLTVSTTGIAPGHLGAGSIASKSIDTVVGISQLIERGNKPALRTAVAEAVANAVRSERDDVVRSQRAALHAAYFDLLQAQDKTRIATETASLFRDSIAAMERRLKAGDVSAMDVSRMSVDALRAQNDERAARAELARARATLAYLMGAEAMSERIVAADAWPRLRNVVDEAHIAASIDARPDVRAAAARTLGADSNAELARSLRTRDITIGAQVERYPGTSPSNSVGFTLSIPLFTRYYYDGEIRRAEVDREAAQDALARTRALAATEIGKARADLLSAHDRLARFDAGLTSAAEKAAQGAEFAYAKGALGVMDLLDARRQLTATRFEAITARADYAKALSAWRAALAQDLNLDSGNPP